MENPQKHTSPERFTTDGSDSLEQRLKELCDLSLEGIRSIIPEAHLEGVLLGGGYGRGEGGVLRLEDGDHPYNDLEFFVMVKGGSVWSLDRRFGSALHELGERLSPDAGMDVEFKIFSFQRLRQASVNMFFYDLVARSRWIAGDESMLNGCEHHLDASKIPLNEATRLLMNRSSGLLFSKAKLAAPSDKRTEADKDFIGRNLSKLDLAFGDVILTTLGTYHWSCQERLSRLSSSLKEQASDYPEDFQQLLEPYQEAVAFKQHPSRSSAMEWDELESRWERSRKLSEQVWIWLESKRLGVHFKSGADYAAWSGNLCPETFWLKNFLVNLKSFKGSAMKSPLFRYPRERLFKALSLALWANGLELESGNPVSASSHSKLQLASALGIDPSEVSNLQGADWISEVRVAYERLWNRFN